MVLNNFKYLVLFIEPFFTGISLKFSILYQIGVRKLKNVKLYLAFIMTLRSELCQCGGFNCDTFCERF